ncbi:hypothetical protein ACA910_021109 [Epithemia clementina (nom. ined.)]
MNPSGYRIEEKKEPDSYHHHHNNNNNNNNHHHHQPHLKQHPSTDEKSTHSYKSTHSSRSSVLERAREYNRRIDQQNNNRRAKSLERSSDASDYSDTTGGDRSRSVGRSPQTNNSGNTISTHERAMASVRKDSAKQSHQLQQQQQQQQAATPTTPALARRLKSNQILQQQVASVEQSPVTPASTNISRNTATRTTPASAAVGGPRNGVTATPQSSSVTPRRTAPVNNNNTSNHKNPNGNGGGPSRPAHSPNNNNNNNNSKSLGRPQQQQPQQPQSKAMHHQPLQRQPPPGGGGDGDDEGQNHNAVVTPELLVDALSGHEDGLLAIAEKLMEHYDAGYDVMGEAIIDAFADVQKLFQHVVEAAHMEGAAFEASRREAELSELRKQQEAAGLPVLDDPTSGLGGVGANAPTAPVGRHDEFVDQDVKDVLTEAIRKGTAMRDANQHEECYRMYEQACQSASALLPVDSDHRGRLQLSIARAESMGPDRACAILRYAMDDVLRSGMRAGRTPLPDPSKRADVVLSRPAPSAAGSAASHNGTGTTSASTGSNFYKVAQSPDEALASLMEEMKEIMSAPVYNDTPLQSVAIRFWTALTESQKSQQKNEERLEQALGKLKGDFLLARAEWEEKLNKCNEKAEMYKEKYEKLKDTKQHSSRHNSSNGSSITDGGGDDLMEQARNNYRGLDDRGRRFPTSTNITRGASTNSRTGSVASLGSGIAVHAKRLVNSIHDFNCNSDRAADQQVRQEIQDMAKHSHAQRSVGAPSKSPHRNNAAAIPGSTRTNTMSSSSNHNHNNNNNNSGASSRSFREYSKSPKRMDV